MSSRRRVGPEDGSTSADPPRPTTPVEPSGAIDDPAGPADGGRQHREASELVELVRYLESRIQDRRLAVSVLERIGQFLAADPEAQWRQAPGIYLLLEHFLSEHDRQPLAVDSLRMEVQARFGSLLARPRLGLIFESEDVQEVLLCQRFLRPLLGQALALAGEKADASLQALARWLDRFEDLDGEELARTRGEPLAEPGKRGGGQRLRGPERAGWAELLGRLGHDLYEHLARLLGEPQARDLYQQQYVDLADDYLPLASFSAVVHLFPPQLIDERKLSLLSRSQTRRVLLEKLDELQATNDQLSEAYAEQQMALEVLERSREELEKRVTERTKALETANRELQESEERLRSISEAARDAILMIDSKGRTSYVNPAAERMLGYPRSQLVGYRLLEKVVPKRFRGRFREAFSESLKTGRGPAVDQTGEFIARRSDGQEIPVELSISSVEIDGRWHLVGVMRDIAQRKRTEAQRRHLEEQFQERQRLESLGVLTGGLAHDFNNLLTTVLGHVGLMEQLSSSAHPFTNNLGAIRQAAQRAAELTQQMLAYSGRGHFLVQAVDLSALVGEMEALLRAPLSKGARLLLDLEPGLPAVAADPIQIQQLLVNLVANASDALGDDGGAEGGDVIVRLRRIDGAASHLKGYGPGVGRTKIAATSATEGYGQAPHGWGSGVSGEAGVELEVSDTGSGMEEEIRAKIFEPFFSTKFTGRGLGLAAVLGIVRGHQGAIDVRSEPGQGTTVRVLLPLAQEAEEGTPRPDPLEVDLGAFTALVVDDEPGVRFLIATALESLGMRVLVAEDGRQGVRVFRHYLDEVDIVLLDLTMPNMDGEQALNAMQELRSDIRVIVASGYGRGETLERFRGRRIAGFVSKPFEIPQLMNEVRRALRRTPRAADPDRPETGGREPDQPETGGRDAGGPDTGASQADVGPSEPHSKP